MAGSEIDAIRHPRYSFGECTDAADGYACEICLRDKTASGRGGSFGLHGAGAQWSTLSGYYISRAPGQ